VGEYWNSKSGSSSKVPNRIAALIQVATGQQVAVSDPHELPAALAERGYQLLTATAGTLLEARRQHCRNAVLLVHEFRPEHPPPVLAEQLTAAQDDLDAFIKWLSAGEHVALPTGQVLGPIGAPRYGVIDLFVAKCRTALE
jgi:hypothetical protein